MRVRIQEYKFGGYTFEPVNRATIKSFHRNMIENGCAKADCLHSLLLQREDIQEYIPPSKLKDLDGGWDIHINMNGWLVRQFFGYCTD